MTASLPPLSDDVVTPDVQGMVMDEARRVARTARVVLAPSRIPTGGRWPS